MPILALDSATGACAATLVAADDANGAVIAERMAVADRGQTSLLPEMVRDCLRQAGLSVRQLTLIAVTVGPGSFTGIRGAVALAQGLALGAGVPIVGVTVGEAISEALIGVRGLPGDRTLWVATPSRRGHVFLERDGRAESFAVTALPACAGRVALAGTAAADVASRLAARGDDILLTNVRFPAGEPIARVAWRRHRGTVPPLAAEPLYVDPPAVRPNQSGAGDD